jgi:hypothetical protein
VFRPVYLAALTLALASVVACRIQPPAPTPPVVIKRDAATPIPSPTASPIPTVAILAVRGGTIGSPSAFLIHAPPGATCTVDYHAPPGSQSAPLVVPPVVADQTGNARIIWSIPDKTAVGIAHVTITCDGRQADADFPIQMPTIE